MATAHIARHPNRDPELKLGEEQCIVDAATHSRGDHIDARISWVLLNAFAVSLGPGHARSVATSSPHGRKWLSVPGAVVPNGGGKIEAATSGTFGGATGKTFFAAGGDTVVAGGLGTVACTSTSGAITTAASVPRSAIFVSAAIMFAADMEWSTKRANPASAVPQKTTQPIGHAILRRRGSATSGSGLMGPVVLEQSLSVTLSDVGPLGPCCRIAVELRAGVCTGDISGSHCSECARGVPIAARISPTDRPEESSSSIDLIVLSRSVAGKRSFNPS